MFLSLEGKVADVSAFSRAMPHAGSPGKIYKPAVACEWMTDSV
jgi:hypothetical protein